LSRKLTLVDILDVNVGKLSLHLLDLAHPLLFRNVMSDVNLLVVQEHAIDGLDGGIGSLGGLVVDETVPSGTTVLVGSDLAGEDVSERGKGIMKGLYVGENSRDQRFILPSSSSSSQPTDLVIDLLVQILDKNIPSRALPQRRVTLGPHDPTRSTLDQRVVQRVQGSFPVRPVEVVDVGVPEGSSGDGVPANSDTTQVRRGEKFSPGRKKKKSRESQPDRDVRSDRSDHVEDLEKHRLGHTRVQLSHVEGSTGGGPGLSLGGGSLGLGGGGRGRSLSGGGLLSLGLDGGFFFGGRHF
jgi:hypothetical protein